MSLPVFDGTGWITGMPGLPIVADDPEPQTAPDPDEADTPTDTPAEAPEPGDEPTEPIEVTEEFDPSDHTVAEVQAYLDEHPDETDAVLDRERAGKARTTLIGA
jgi:hypothetical protein